MKNNLSHTQSNVLQEHAGFEQVLTDIAHKLANITDAQFDNAITESLKELVLFLGFDRSTIMSFSPDGNNLIVTHSWVRPGCPPVPKDMMADVGTWYNRQIRSGHIVRISNASDLPAEAETELNYLRESGLKSTLSIPLIIEETVIGALAFGIFSQERPWHEQDVFKLRLAAEIFAFSTRRRQYEQGFKDIVNSVDKLATNLARKQTPSDEHMRRTAIALMRTEHNERCRMAELLYNEVLQILASIAMFMETAKKKVNSDTKSADFSESLDLFQNAFRRLRQLAFELQPEAVFKTEIPEGLSWLANKMQQIHDINIEVCTHGDVKSVSKDSQLFLYDAARKLIENVAMHSKAGKARLELSQPDPQHIRLVISDNGVGFDPALLKEIPDTSFGLFSIREQAKLLGGSLELRTSPGKGTHVSITVPA